MTKKIWAWEKLTSDHLLKHVSLKETWKERKRKDEKKREETERAREGRV